MTHFQGSGFSIELPESAVDASAYTFAFPKGRPFTPTLVIRVEQRREAPDLAAYVTEQRQRLSAAVEAFEVLREKPGRWGAWDYIMTLFEWGPPDGRIRQEQFHILVPGRPNRLFILTATDTAGDFAATDPLFNEILRTFKPNDIQVL